MTIPHHFARYRVDDNGKIGVLDMTLYPDDLTLFTDEAGAVWRRVAQTTQAYMADALARAELDAAEQAAHQAAARAERHARAA